MIHVAIAEDEQIVRQALAGLIESTDEFHVVATASDGAQAVEMVHNHEIDVLLLDIDMPGMNGIEFLRQIDSEGRSVPTLALSSYPEEEYAVRAFRLGARGYLRKLVELEELLRAIRTVAAGGRYVSERAAEALAEFARSSASGGTPAPLSDREFEVLRSIARGMEISSIAERMHVAPSTVSTYRRRLLDKLGMRTNSELIAYAFRNGIES